jgi:hypothetical protein
MTGKDKMVGGRTREEWLAWIFDHRDMYLDEVTLPVTVLREFVALLSAHSRGLREGLERAAKVLCPSCAAGVPVKGDKHDNGVALPYHCLAYLVRAEASKLDGKEPKPYEYKGKSFEGRCDECGARSCDGMHPPDPPAEEREPCSCHLGSVCTEACGYRICHDGCPRWGG